MSFHICDYWHHRTDGTWIRCVQLGSLFQLAYPILIPDVTGLHL